ncbi:hypothetical protein ON010_g7248 [Phytophthora cinnamomi]|nr:hypothetical protein ON010_g7248 [Phytophthora cinnamomi]
MAIYLTKCRAPPTSIRRFLHQARPASSVFVHQRTDEIAKHYGRQEARKEQRTHVHAVALPSSNRIAISAVQSDHRAPSTASTNLVQTVHVRALQPVGEHYEAEDNQILVLEARKGLVLGGSALLFGRILAAFLHNKELPHGVEEQQTQKQRDAARRRPHGPLESAREPRRRQHRPRDGRTVVLSTQIVGIRYWVLHGTFVVTGHNRLTTAGQHGGAQDDGDQREEGGQAAQEVRRQQGGGGERGPHDERGSQVPVGAGAGALGRQEAADPAAGRGPVRPVLGLDM